jgi:hypothetical protein
MERKESKNRMGDETVSGPFGKKLHRLAEKTKCLKDISRAKAKLFDDLWNDAQNKIMGLNGKMNYTRELVITLMTQHASRAPLINTTHVK